MANTYTPEQLGIKAPAGGFQQGSWINGRQYWGGSFSDPGVIHPSSDQQGAGQAVSSEVNAQSAAAQGKTPQQINGYIQQQSKVTVPGGGTPAPQNYPPGGDPNAGGGGMGAGFTTPETINLPEMYKTLYNTSGIKDLQDQINSDTEAYNKAQSTINDNPYLSEASRTGELQKLSIDHNNAITTKQNALAMKKADIETELNLRTKQFDIESQAAQQGLQQLNSLLSMGALDNANGADIANLTKTTGVSSSLIQSAISASKQSKIKSQVLTHTADSGEVTVSVINPDTGEIIKQTSLGKVGNAQNGSAKTTESDKKSYYQNALREDASRGVALKDIFKIYTGIIDPNEILQLYNANSMYGIAKESPDQLQSYGVKPPSNPL